MIMAPPPAPAAVRSLIALLLGVASVHTVHAIRKPKTGRWHANYRAFIEEAATGKLRAPFKRSERLGIHWMGPFTTGGGYSEEATNFAIALHDNSNINVSIYQLGGPVNEDYMKTVVRRDAETLDHLFRVATTDPEQSISVCHSPPTAWQVFDDSVEVNYARLEPYQVAAMCPRPYTPYGVGRTMFETDSVPAPWVRDLNKMREVWVPSGHVEAAFARGGVRRDRLLLVPEPVDVDFYNPAPYAAMLRDGVRGAHESDATSEEDEEYIVPHTSAYASLLAEHGMRVRECDEEERPGDSPECPFRFLSVGKIEYRKGFDVLLTAYMAEFARWKKTAGGTSQAKGKRDKRAWVELYVVTTTAHNTTEQLIARVESVMPGGARRPLRCSPEDSGVTPEEIGRDDATCIPPAAWADLPPVTVLTALPQALLPAIYASGDALVLPTRGEGWGRPITDAMAMALPVIATNWSGPTEYLREGNSYPLPITGLAAATDGASQAGHKQAVPDVRTLRRLMRHVLTHQDEARGKGYAGRADMVALYAPDVVAQFVIHQVDRITQLLREDEDEDTKKAEENNNDDDDHTDEL